MAAQAQFDPTTECQSGCSYDQSAQSECDPTTECRSGCSSDQSTHPSEPVAPALAAPWYIQALPYIFHKNTVKSLLFIRNALLIVGTLLVFDSTTLTRSGFSFTTSWWRAILIGIGYLSYYGVSLAHTILAPAVKAVAMKMDEFKEFSKTVPPECMELVKTMAFSPIEVSSDGSIMHLPQIDRANLPELTPEMERDAVAVVVGFMQDTMLAYKKIRQGDKNPLSHLMPEPATTQAVIEEILDDEDGQVVEMPCADSSYEDLSTLEKVEEIVVGTPPSKSD